MAYFTGEFLAFFKGLAAHNDTAWFDANRKTYETAVKKPFVAFVEEMIGRIAEHEPEVTLEAKDAIFRINRDTRFAKDKTPYNTYVAANISKYGRKDKGYPGFYFQLSHEGVQVFGGAYAPEKEALQNIRTLIAGDDRFDRLIRAAAFKKHYGTIQGDVMKRIPEEWKVTYQRQPLVANKQFYFQSALPAAVMTDAKLPDRMMELYRSAKDVSAFLRKAFG